MPSDMRSGRQRAILPRWARTTVSSTARRGEALVFRLCPSKPPGGVFQAAEPIAHAPSDAPTAACRSLCDTGSGHRLGARCGPIGAFLGGGELERPGHRFPLEQPGVRNRSGARKDYRASFATASRYEGRNDSTAAQNLGPCPGTSRWHISWTTTYSRHSGG